MRWGECQFLIDSLQHAKTVFKHLVIPKTQHAVSLILQISISLLVFVTLFNMLAAVQLYEQFPRQTSKIRNIGSYGLLPTKFVAAQLLVAQEAPEETLGGSLILPK